MKSFFRSSVMSLLGLALAFCGFTVDFIVGVAGTVHRVVTETCHWIATKTRDLFDRMVAKLTVERALRAPSVLLVSAKAFALRKIRRETPRIENSWRMCPST